MEEYKQYITQNPQIVAAIITAICGILGIFINIVVNIYFRSLDYKDKYKIKQIENMELYYFPLREDVARIIKALENIDKHTTENLYEILACKIGACYANKVSILNSAIKDVHNHLVSKVYKVQEDYKLYKSYMKVKNRIEDLNQYINNPINSSNETRGEEFLEELKELIYRIQCCEIRIMIDNIVIRCWKRLTLYFNWKKNKKV